MDSRDIPRRPDWAWRGNGVYYSLHSGDPAHNDGAEEKTTIRWGRGQSHCRVIASSDAENTVKQGRLLALSRLRRTLTKLAHRPAKQDAAAVRGSHFLKAVLNQKNCTGFILRFKWSGWRTLLSQRDSVLLALGLSGRKKEKGMTDLRTKRTKPTNITWSKRCAH